jgi:hypothetical protein
MALDLQYAPQVRALSTDAGVLWVMRRPLRHTAFMAVSFMVRGSSEAECQAALERLCRLLGAVVTQRPSDRVGPGWVARAVPTPTAPAEVGRGRE